MPEVLIIAGEASGDLHGAGVADELRTLRPDVPLVGMGGERMAAAGVHLFATADGVVGFAEVIKHLPAHLRLLRRVRALLRSGRIGLVILIDYPGFNLRVAQAAHAAGVPVLYYITPQVWAWKPGRLKMMAQVITKAAVILPFEEELLRDAGIDATFVGHPLLDRALAMPGRAEARRRIGLADDALILALFPGSRAQEIERHLGEFEAVARELQRRRPGLQVVVSVAPSIELDAARVPFPMVRAQSFDVLRAADVALCKSGTTTLEAAVAGCPCVVVYKTSRITFAIARRLVTIPHIGLLNVVAGREVAPEFVQDAFTTAAVADALDPLFDDGNPVRERMVQGMAEVRQMLGASGAAGRVARIASGMVPMVPMVPMGPAT